MASAARIISAPDVPQEALDELSRRIAAGQLELPLLPGVAMEVTNAAAAENSDARMLADLLKRDQALAAHVLRVVSSPLYSGRTQLVSLQQAVARLGAQKIREVAVAIAFRVGVFKLKGFEADVARLFKHSISAALFAQEIARATRRNVEDAFMCGLLHDVGRPVLLQGLVTILAEQNVSAPTARVLAATGELHASVGFGLARSWTLPETVVAAVEQHHAPGANAAASVWITALADELACFAFEPERMPEEEVRRHPALAALEIYPDMLDKLLGKAEGIRQAAGVLT